MNPVAFSVFGVSIRWYGILIASGLLLGVFIAQYTCRVKGVDFERFLDIILLSVPIGIVGARLYYVIFEFGYYKNNPLEIFNTRSGGLAIHGGLIFGILTAILYTRAKDISFIKYADIAAPSIIIAQAMGRWGNFFNQEAHGGVVSKEFISHFPQFIQRGMFIEGNYYHPTFLYESAWNLIVFFILICILKKSKVDGKTFFSYIGLYSIGRFFIEGLRTDSLMIGPLRVAQLVSLSGVAIWLVFLLISKKRKKYWF